MHYQNIEASSLRKHTHICLSSERPAVISLTQTLQELYVEILQIKVDRLECRNQVLLRTRTGNFRGREAISVLKSFFSPSNKKISKEVHS